MAPFQGSKARVHRLHDEGQLPNDARHAYQSPWLTTAEAAAYLRYEGQHPLVSVYRFLKRHGIVAARRGRRSLLIARADLDRALTGGRRKAV